jgi:hypothetical protein
MAAFSGFLPLSNRGMYSTLADAPDQHFQLITLELSYFIIFQN